MLVVEGIGGIIGVVFTVVGMFGFNKCVSENDYFIGDNGKQLRNGGGGGILIIDGHKGGGILDVYKGIEA